MSFNDKKINEYWIYLVGGQWSARQQLRSKQHDTNIEPEQTFSEYLNFNSNESTTTSTKNHGNY